MGKTATSISSTSSSTSSSSSHPARKRKLPKTKASESSSDTSAAKRRRSSSKGKGAAKRSKSKSRKRRSKSRRRSKSARRSPIRPVWGRGSERGSERGSGISRVRGSERGSEPKLPSYALAHISQAALDAYQAPTEEPRCKTGLVLLGDLCQGPKVARWTYILKDEARRCFAGYLKSPFSKEQCFQFYKTAYDGTSWKRPRDMPRGTAWMVAKGCTCSYRYGGHEMEPEEYPPWMLEIMRAAMPFFGLEQAAEWPNSCNLNLYDTGGSSVAWHADDEALFNGKFQDARILSLSLGVQRTFELRPNFQSDSKASEWMNLGDGDLCTMEGMAQKHYEHRVPPSNVEGPRINLTWRWTVRHTPRCPARRMQPD
ncbi:unnamed protein product [Polarella glacialis]|uniref:Fe2OG dioxygenase domain-containing protein n=1 Tax=Polarella glacialis TaxID=89957 RepID=A0A813D2Z8_POLGL|nr:unnamed protein product [Polarella glacialis]